MIIGEYKWIPTYASHLEQCIHTGSGVWRYTDFGAVDTTFGEPPNKLRILIEAGMYHVELLGLQVLNSTKDTMLKCTVGRYPKIRQPGDVQVQPFNLNTECIPNGERAEHIIWGMPEVDEGQSGRVEYFTYVPGGVELPCCPPTPIHLNSRGLLLVEIEVVSGNVAEAAYTLLIREYPDTEE